MENKIIFECRYEYIINGLDRDNYSYSQLDDADILRSNSLEGLYELIAFTKLEKEWKNSRFEYGEVEFGAVREIQIINENDMDIKFLEKTKNWQDYVKQEEIKKKQKEEQDEKNRVKEEKRKQEEELKMLEKLRDKYGL